MTISIYAGLTDQTVDVFIPDSSSTTGAGLSGLVYNSSGLKVYYRKGATGSATQLTLATQTVGGAHSDGGFVEIDATNMKGVYRLDLSDTIVASEGYVTLYVYGATNAAPVPIRINCNPLPVDVKKFGGTAGTFSGGRPEVNTTHIAGSAVSTTTAQLGVNVVQISADATAADNCESFFDGTGYAGTNNVIPTVTTTTTATNVTTVNGLAAGVITAASIAADAITDAKVASDVTIASVTGSVGSVTGAVGSVTGNVGGNVTGSVGSIAAGGISSSSFAAGAINNAAMSIDGSELTAIPWNASWDAEVQSEVDDALVAQRLDELLNADSDIDGAAPPTVGSVFHELMTKTTGSFTFDQTTDSLEALRDRGDAAWITATAVTVSAGGITASSFAAGAIDAAAIAADAIGSSELAASAVTEIQSGLSTLDAAAVRAAVGLASANLDTQLSTIDTVVDSILVDTAEIGAAGAGLTALATQASVNTIDDFLDTEVAAILADTNELQTDLADGGRLDLLVDAIKAKTDSLTFTVAGVVDANTLRIDGSTEAADRLQRSTETVCTVTVGAASTTTSVVTSSMSPSAAVTDQFKGRILIFARDTTTSNLRGQATDITASTAGGVLTCTALTTAPASGDVGVIV